VNHAAQAECRIQAAIHNSESDVPASCIPAFLHSCIPAFLHSCLPSAFSSLSPENGQNLARSHDASRSRRGI
jgi:hypothetical protein